jgi:8-oxo-dGTP pyrophosphatase MutT (NUDIX family)
MNNFSEPATASNPGKNGGGDPTHKHATSSVFLFALEQDAWRIGLIDHPRLGRWMLPGGHVEPHENPAEAALREVLEETGLSVDLLNPHASDLTLAVPGVPLPLWIVEQQVPPEPRHPHRHVHIDYLYIAVTRQIPRAQSELRFAWYTGDNLADLHMFEDSRSAARLLFDRLRAAASAAFPPSLRKHRSTDP